MYVYLIFINIRKILLKYLDEMFIKIMGFFVDFNCSVMVGELNWKIYFDFQLYCCYILFEWYKKI